MHILIHYSEIGLKGKNRPDFERKLLNNIKQNFSKGQVLVKRLFGRFVLETELDFKNVKPKLERVFGIAYFAPCLETSSQMDNIKSASQRLVVPWTKKFNSFAIRAKTTQGFPIRGSVLEKELGTFVKEKFKKIVNLGSPELTIYIEGVDQKTGFVYVRKTKGLGGLPVGVSGKSVSLLSGGIDSPVASYLMNSRGTKNVFAHFHSYPQTSMASIEKVKKIAKILSDFQGKSTLYLIPFLEFQKTLFKDVDERFLVILYRRMMLKIAEKICQTEGAEAIITGDSLGQVASQTITNLDVQTKAVSTLILRPLIGLSKEKIIRIGQEIGTYEISILPHEDCCQLFVPKHPKTRAKTEDILRIEATLPVEKMMKEAMGKAEVINI